jgi:hypothetical protein
VHDTDNFLLLIKGEEDAVHVRLPTITQDSNHVLGVDAL